MTSYWLEASRAEHDVLPVEAADAPLPEEVLDVLVLGAGLTGVACAYWLSKFGRDVCLLDPRGVSGGATGRNGGHLSPHISLSDPELTQFELGSVNELKAFIETEGIDCELRQGGSLSLRSQSETEMPRPEDIPSPCSLWDQEKVAAAMHTDQFGWGIFNPEACQLWPAKLVYSMAQRALDTGHTRIFENYRVASVSPPASASEPYAVTTDCGKVLKARHVVSCLNGYSAQVFPSLKEVLWPVKNQVQVTQEAPPLWSFAFSCGGGGAEQIYAMQRPDGRVVAGGSRALAPQAGVGDDDDDPSSTPLNGDVTAKLTSFLEQFEPLAVDREWSGILGFTKDGKPLIGQLPTDAFGPSLFISAGYGGHGMPYCFACGRHIAEQLTQQEATCPFLDRFSPTSPDRALGLTVNSE